jgi:hypothetical protein
MVDIPIQMQDCERELARIRSDPRYGIDGADDDLMERELALLIAQAQAQEIELAQRRRSVRRR